jgi:hypothetical protein
MNSSIGDTVRTALKSDTQTESEFLKTLPTGQWILAKLEGLISRSDVIAGMEYRSPYAVVIAVGPEFRADVAPGDRVTYAEALSLPKELKSEWVKKYVWIHENKFLGRLPRNADEKQMRKPAPAVATPSDADGDEARAFAARVAHEFKLSGLGPDGLPLPKDSQ